MEFLATHILWLMLCTVLIVIIAEFRTWQQRRRAERVEAILHRFEDLVSDVIEDLEKKYIHSGGKPGEQEGYRVALGVVRQAFGRTLPHDHEGVFNV